ncbi:hypothetical protein H4R20_006913 [Coemansia guatemalensis]|uniref:Uncharacterized protein n=1 Tax=Coemansia guatemalensis TaxID=2761395 RepID=A0A9W8HTT9_9FUNG|nr:hypothetical protein H4R20_006913 [Coemansia guatemalensis]
MNNNNQRNIPVELRAPNRFPRHSAAPGPQSEPGTPRPRGPGTPVRSFSRASTVVQVAQPPASPPTPQGNHASTREVIVMLECEAARLRGTLPENLQTGAELQQTFVTARQTPGTVAQGRPAFRLDEEMTPGAPIRAYPNPVPPANERAPTTPHHRGQTTRVATHGLYAAISPVPGAAVADGYDGTYLHGTPSYAHLGAVPGAYPRSVFRRQTDDQPGNARPVVNQPDDGHVTFMHPLTEH